MIITFVDRPNEGLDVALAPEQVRRRREGAAAAGDGAGVYGNAGGVIAAVLEAAEAVEEDLQDEAPLSGDVEVQVGEYPTHFSAIGNDLLSLEV